MTGGAAGRVLVATWVEGRGEEVLLDPLAAAPTPRSWWGKTCWCMAATRTYEVPPPNCGVSTPVSFSFWVCNYLESDSAFRV